GIQERMGGGKVVVRQEDAVGHAGACRGHPRPSRCEKVVDGRGEPGHDERTFGAHFMSDEMTPEKVQALITRGPYHQWLGLKVTAVHDDGNELTATPREEGGVNPERRYTHGGMLAALDGLAADRAV